MSEHTPITGELRRVMNHTTMAGCPLVELGEFEFGHRCDAIDAVHAALERENAELRERVAVLDKRSESMHDGGRITDELRAWAKGSTLSSWTAEHLTAIADRIDGEHERQLGVLYRDMSDAEWVRLPVDVDGVPFHIGELVDERLPFGGYSAPAPIDTMELYRGASGYGWMVKLDAENRASISPELLRHHHEPTVEDVLTEFGIDWEYESDCEDRAALLREYAAKLRLVNSEE